LEGRGEEVREYFKFYVFGSFFWRGGERKGEQNPYKLTFG
jgi:hypothetical protein